MNDCPDLARELDAFDADPITRESGMGGEMAPLLIERHEARHGCGAQPASQRGRQPQLIPAWSPSEPATTRDHRAEPRERGGIRGPLDCRICGRPVRTALGFTVHAMPLPKPAPKPEPSIRQSQLHREPNEGGTLYSAEASQLGLRPGIWPDELEILMNPHGMEPAMPETFLRQNLQRGPDGDVTVAVYATRLRQTFLQVFND